MRQETFGAPEQLQLHRKKAPASSRQRPGRPPALTQRSELSAQRLCSCQRLYGPAAAVSYVTCKGQYKVRDIPTRVYGFFSGLRVRVLESLLSNCFRLCADAPCCLAGSASESRKNIFCDSSGGDDVLIRYPTLLARLINSRGLACAQSRWAKSDRAHSVVQNHNSSIDTWEPY
jgi:hypothetical protein